MIYLREGHHRLSGAGIYIAQLADKRNEQNEKRQKLSGAVFQYTFSSFIKTGRVYKYTKDEGVLKG